MTGHDWPLVERLFHDALALTPGGRSALLAGCPPEVRSIVEELLSHRGEDCRIARAVENAATLVSQPSPCIGPYRLVREIGQGGMGSVYLAVRADDVFEKQVAIKFVRLGMDSPALFRRFEEERRILARLEHPNIARLIDGGAAPDGRPYLVMEYVDGCDIVTYGAAHALSVRDRVTLFLEVCAAVQCAHQSLIVHRDLKPGNIMIDVQGRPKLLDFGVAKLLDHDPAPAGATIARMLTPDYASPEQIVGGPATTATDVYALGIVLYELLAGERPFRFEGLTTAECERAILEGRVPPPSSRAPVVRGQIRGDLDNIVLKAMRADAAARYATVAELAADLRRYLEGRPVLARRYTPVQRSFIFVRRHRATAIAAAAIFAAVLVGAASTTVAAVQARRERAAAEAARLVSQRQRALAESSAADALQQRRVAELRLADERLVLSRFVQDFYSRMNNLPGATGARLDFLRIGIPQIEKLHAESPADAGLCDTLAHAYFQMGELLGAPNAASFGDQRQAFAYLSKARGIMEQVLAVSPRNADAWIGLGEVLRSTGALLVRSNPDPGAALPYINRAIESGRRALALAPREPQPAIALGRFYIERVQYELQRHGNTNKEEDLRQAARLADLARTLGAHGNDAVQQLGDLQSATGQIHMQQSDYRGALPYLEAACASRAKLLTLAPNDAQAMRLAMFCQSYLGTTYRAIDGPGSRRHVEAYLNTAAFAGKLTAADPGDRTARYDFAMSLNHLAQAHIDAHEYSECAVVASRSVAVFRELRPRLDWIERRNFAYTLVVLGDAFRFLGRQHEAADAWREALAEADAVIAQSPRDAAILRVAAFASHLLALYAPGPDSLDLANRAVAYGERAVATQDSSGSRLRLARSRGVAALVLQREGQPERALTLARASLEILGRVAPEDLVYFPENERAQVQELLASHRPAEVPAAR